MADTTPHHAAGPRTYFLVFATLLVLTASTVLVASVPLGPFHTLVAVLIAFAKATLIVLFFMHGLESGRLVQLVLLGALLWLGILFAFTLADYWSRGLDLAIRNPTP
jgi:cytochrome c oxidase subunit 4